MLHIIIVRQDYRSLLSVSCQWFELEAGNINRADFDVFQITMGLNSQKTNYYLKS